MGLGLVDRELKPHHEPPHLRHRLLGVASAADHEIISIDHDLRAKPRLQTSPLPSQHKSPHVQIGEQWGDRSALRNPAARVPGGCRSCLPSSAVVFFNRRLQPHLDQMQQVPVRDPARHRFQKFGVRDRPEVVREVRVNDPRVPLIDQAVDSANRRVSAQVRSVAVQLRRHVDLEDGFQHHRRGRHHHAVRYPRNPERTKLLAVRLRNPHPSDCLGSIRLPVQFVRQFTKPAVFPIRFDVRKVLPVHARCALVGLAPIVGVPQHVLAIQLVVQKVEPIAPRTLRFRL